ncbi:hypothetical protein FI667_g17577, partial [Globisporangium splendens]
MLGCLFHFKQALRCKMANLHIPAFEIHCAVGKDVIDLLCVMENKIDPHDIICISTKIRASLREASLEHSTSKWNEFWVYSKKTWLKLYPHSEFSNVRGKQRPIVDRTDNPLERHNRELNDAFEHPKPSIPMFVTTAESLANRYAELLRDIAQETAQQPRHNSCYIPREFNSSSFSQSVFLAKSFSLSFYYTLSSQLFAIIRLQPLDFILWCRSTDGRAA